MNLKGKVALITGGARGIGKSIAISLAKEGSHVIINYHTSEIEAIHLKKQIEDNYNVKVFIVKADVSDEEAVKSMIDRIITEFGKIDIVVNNAGIALDSPIYEKTKQEFMRVLEVNTVGTFLVSKHASLFMNEGIIINISSTDAIDTYNELSIDYCASKAAMNSLTKTLAVALPHIKVIALMPLWVNTESVREMNPTYLLGELKRTGQGRLLEPDEVAIEVVKLINSDIATGSLIRMEEYYV